MHPKLLNSGYNLFIYDLHLSQADYAFVITTNHYNNRTELRINLQNLNQRSQRDDSRIQKERNKANDFTCKLQYDVSIFFFNADSQILRNVHS